VYEDLAAAQQEPALASSLYTMSARVYEGDLGDMDSAVKHYRTVLTIDPNALHAAESLERIFRRPSATRSCRRSSSRRPTSSTGRTTRRRPSSRPLQHRGRRPPAARRGHRRVHRVLELDSEDLRAIDALIKLYLNLSRWSDLLGVYVRKADLVSDPDEKKGIYYQIGAVYERELADVPRAIDTYQRVLELDPVDLQALSAARRALPDGQNWAELLSVLQQEAELANDPAKGSATSTGSPSSTRSGSTTPPARSSSTAICSQQMPDHEPTLAALEGIKNGPKEALGAALVLEPIYDATGEWRAS
jgi:tetratricopeptide (TPR) repeat protein